MNELVSAVVGLSKLVVNLGVLVPQVLWQKRNSVNAFRRRLVEQGVDPSPAAQLAKAYGELVSISKLSKFIGSKHAQEGPPKE